MIAIVDMGGANLASIQFALERLGQRSQVTRDEELIRSASHVIFPGVGHAGHAMSVLHRLNLFSVLRSLTQPVLGICLGMQILYEYSEEGGVECLGLLGGRVTQLQSEPGLRVPHMGWNTLKKIRGPLFREVSESSFVYFVHSFRAPPSEFNDAMSDDPREFPAAASVRNYYGVQFHPEKSGAVGAQILRNFLELRSV